MAQEGHTELSSQLTDDEDDDEMAPHHSDGGSDLNENADTIVRNYNLL